MHCSPKKNNTAATMLWHQSDVKSCVPHCSLEQVLTSLSWQWLPCFSSASWQYLSVLNNVVICSKTTLLECLQKNLAFHQSNIMSFRFIIMIHCEGCMLWHTNDWIWMFIFSLQERHAICDSPEMEHTFSIANHRRACPALILTNKEADVSFWARQRYNRHGTLHVLELWLLL